MVAAAGGMYATHMRSEDDRVEEAIEEAIRISRESAVNLEISHFKACNKNNWHKVPHMLEMLEHAADEGLSVSADRYPYIAYSTGLSAFLPLWARQGDSDDILDRLKDESTFYKIKDYIKGRGNRIGGWDQVIISQIGSDQYKYLEGLSIEQCSQEFDKDPLETIRHLLIKNDYKVGIVGFAMNEENLERVLSHPLVMPGSDGDASSPVGVTGIGKPHPRRYGTFARYFGKYYRQKKLFSLETAIHKMTAMPAHKLGLKSRGEIREGYFADLVLFDHDTFIDRATFTDPHQFATGVRHLFVNGQHTVKDGKHLGVTGGQILKKC